MEEIPKEKLEGAIQFLAGNQARVALEEIRKGKTLGEAVLDCTILAQRK